MTEQDLPTLDPGVLRELRESVGGDDAFITDLVETYLADSAGQLDAIDAALAANDIEAVVRPAHTLKSSSASVGVRQLSETCRALELDARAGHIDGGSGRAAVARAQRTEASKALRALVAELASR